MASRVELPPVPAMTGTRLLGLLDDDLDDPQVLVVVQGGRLAGGPDRDQPVDAGGDLLVDQAAQGLLVDARRCETA